MPSGLQQEQTILLGHISGLYGVKGWVKVFSYTRPRKKILDYTHWILGKTSVDAIVLEAGRAHKEGVIAKLAGVDDRDHAITLLDQEIRVLTDQLPELENQEYYWHQLIGLQVYDTQQQLLGTVLRLMETGANDVLVVIDAVKNEHLIPYIKDQVIKDVNLDPNPMTACMTVEISTYLMLKIANRTVMDTHNFVTSSPTMSKNLLCK